MTVVLYPYLDDLLFPGPSEVQLAEDLAEAQTMAEIVRMDFKHRKIKPMSYPEHTIPGICSKLYREENVPTGRKNSGSYQESKLYTENLPISVRELILVLWLMTSTILVFQWTKYHLRPLQTFLLKEDLDRKLLVAASVKRSLWWKRIHANLNQG